MYYSMKRWVYFERNTPFAVTSVKNGGWVGGLIFESGSTLTHIVSRNSPLTWYHFVEGKISVFEAGTFNNSVAIVALRNRVEMHDSLPNLATK